MATSGNFVTNNSGHGQYIFEWWRTDWGRSGGSGYHNISYRLKSYGGSSNSWVYSNSCSMNVDGTGYSAGKIQMWGGGATTLLSGSKTLWTDGSGNRSFGASAVGALYTNANNTSGSGSWSLDNIPMYGDITGYSGNFNDSNYSPWIDFTNPAGGTTQVWFELPNLTGSTRYAQRNDIGSRHTWTLTEAEMNSIRSAMANVNSTTITYKFANYVGGWVERAWNATFTIVDANPVFSNFTYKDTNSATVAITGNNQYIIQGQSSLQVTVPVADKATAVKSATMSKYLFSVAGISSEATWSNTADVVKSIGVISSSANQTLTVTARDSRSNSKAVTKTVNVVPYTVPLVYATAQRVNDFENTTQIHIEGIASLISVAGVTKNTVNNASGVQYRYRQVGGAWGSWVNRASTYNTSTGAVNSTDFTLSLDNTKEFEFEFKITDKLSSSVQTVIVDKGQSLFRIGLDGKAYSKEQPLMASHVGQIIMSTSLTTPASVASMYGGTWVAWGTGRVPVGVDTGQTEFNTVEKTGGAKTHTLSVNEMPSHYHDIISSNGNTNAIGGGPGDGAYAAGGAGWVVKYFSRTTDVGGGQAHNNLQPYVTCYYWKRTV